MVYSPSILDSYFLSSVHIVIKILKEVVIYIWDGMKASSFFGGVNYSFKRQHGRNCTFFQNLTIHVIPVCLEIVPKNILCPPPKPENVTFSQQIC